MKTIEELDLDPIMKSRAGELLARCPWVVYTSGRRDLTAQARAMAKPETDAQRNERIWRRVKDQVKEMVVV